MYRSIALAAVLSSAMIASGSGVANAGFHHRAKACAGNCYPAYAAYSPCMVIAGGCGTRDCYGGCTIAPCRTAPARHGCCLHHWAKAAAWRCFGGCHARRGGYCGYGCGDGCGDMCGCDGGCGACGYGSCGDGSCGGCGDGACGGGCSSGCASGCSGCSGGQQDGGDVLYDGPAAADQPAPPPIPNSEASLKAGSQYRLVSQSAAGGSGAAAFDQGLASFRARSFTTALQSFEVAATAEPDNAIYQYYRALTLFDLHGAEGGNEALQRAIELEKREAVPQWGKRMERVQGRGRVWIEKARREAGLVR
jgi:hypothetical protein